MSKKDIAIVGISGKFPKSENVQKFWDNIKKSRELIEFYSASQLESLGIPKEKVSDPNYVMSASKIDDPENFDHAFFGYTHEEAALMDPQIRILHEQVWCALEDAGYDPESKPEKVGCFFSASDNMNWRTHAMLLGSSNVNPFFASSISNVTSISRLISYSLDLKGPSYFLDTACSSSLVAIHLACRNLLLKECTIAVAGGVSVSSTTDIGYRYEPGSIFSIDGHCRAFDQDGSGTLSGEGVGVVVLKRLEDALKDNDHVYAVIKSTAVNNDGKSKVGYTAPSVQGQYDCIKLAQEIAGVEPSDIGYIEAHGTGTKLGDPVEIEALNKAFNYDTSHTCAIGSVKTNMGHLDAAAGVAGLIKLAFALYHKSIPATLHFNEPNPQINFKSGPFYVNSNTMPWESDKPRFGGISSFGIGGTNAHAILQEPPKAIKSDDSMRYHLIPIAAQTKSSIVQFQERLRYYLIDNPKLNLADLSYTLMSRRTNYRYKRFLVVKDIDELSEALNHTDNSLKSGNLNEKRLVFMFAGQGSQYFQMGKEMYEQFPYFRSIIDEGLEILNEDTQFDYAKVLGYTDGETSDPQLINETVYTQPLLFLIMYSYAKLLESVGVKPSHMIGHSLGEYVAACLGEVVSFKQALKLIVKRAQLMNSIESGAMLHVEMTAHEVEKRRYQNVSIAAINTPDSCVISGDKASIAKVSDELIADDVIVVPLKTSHAFHSQMMDGILEDFRAAVNECELSQSKIPYVSSTTGLPITAEESKSSDYWVTHLREPVLFSKGLDFLCSEDFCTFIEIGSSKTLTNFLRKNVKTKEGINGMTVSRHANENKDDSFYLLSTLGKLWQLGIPINWSNYYADQRRNKLVIPGYAFDKVVFPARVNPLKKFMEQYNSVGENDASNVESQLLNSDVNEYDSANEDGAMGVPPATEKPELSATYISAQSETEKELVKMWELLFGVAQIGLHDDFFELGGDSLKALTLLKRIHKTFNVEIRVEDFFQRCNIQVLANEIDLAIEVSKLTTDEKKPTNSEQLRF